MEIKEKDIERKFGRIMELPRVKYWEDRRVTIYITGHHLFLRISASFLFLLRSTVIIVLYWLIFQDQGPTKPKEIVKTGSCFGSGARTRKTKMKRDNPSETLGFLMLKTRRLIVVMSMWRARMTVWRAQTCCTPRLRRRKF